MSPAYQRHSLCIGFTWRKHPTAVMSLLRQIESALSQFRPRPHWGKLFTLSDEELARCFPRITEFLALKSDYDPAGKFDNEFLGRILHPGRSLDA
jgi:xylitol oxidase